MLTELISQQLHPRPQSRDFYYLYSSPMKIPETPATLFGPYGSRLKEMEETHGQNGISNPAAILNGRVFREAVHHVAREHLSAGTEVGMTHTFGLRSLLHAPGELPTYREALRTHSRILRDAMIETGRKVKEVLSFGPAKDCYRPDPKFTPQEFADFHGAQAAEARILNVDAAWFETVNTASEGVGIALAAKKYKVPAIISFVLNREGKLLSGESAGDAIREVDAASGRYPLGYSFNCCPVEALETALKDCKRLNGRIIGVYPNASSRNQIELETSNESVGLKEPLQNARYLNYLAKKWGLKIVGGCCGYNHRDVALITAAVQQDLHDIRLPQTDLV